MWDEITNQFPNFSVAVEVKEWIISSHTLPRLWLHIQAEINVNPFK